MSGVAQYIDQLTTPAKDTPDSDRTLARQLLAAVELLVAERSAMRAALLDAVELCEGWVLTKCPAKYREEHLEHLRKLRLVAGHGVAVEAPTPAPVASVTVTQEVTVFDSGGAYTTNCVRNKRASCTSSARTAVERLADKLFDPARWLTRSELDPEQPPHVRSQQWVITAVRKPAAEPT